MDLPALDVVPENLRAYFSITEIDEAEFLVGDLFRRKFAHPPPSFRRHLAALYRDAGGAYHLAGYSHMRPFADVYLSGGSCSNGETIKRMQPEHLAAIKAAGGVYHLVLKYAFRKYANCCDAFFGYSGDARAVEVAYASGFVATEHERLFAHWHKPLPDIAKRALTAKVQALGPF
ncbi:MAG: hypothetical protein ABI846_01100 [Rudaea sp.]